MPLLYRLKNIDLGSTHANYGHAVHTRARYLPNLPGNGYDTPPIVYKENKQSQAILSRFEVAFGELARLFLASDLTPPQRLVKNIDNDVVGLACEHLSHTIARRECLPNEFYQLQHQAGALQISVQTIEEQQNIPYYFLSQFPQGFFNTLCDAAKQGKICLDMESLASVLTSSYSLEEDDLHKGNFGFYVVDKASKPQVVFFKIDHDLMLADSVMSHYQQRYFHWFLHGVDAYAITERDLIHFPHILDSHNYYWPTINRSTYGVMGNVYHSKADQTAFSDLAQSPEFCSFKWREFYKHVLIPPRLIEQSLNRHLDHADPTERAQLALITQSVVVRQATLRAVLFAIPEFRKFVSSIDEPARLAMLQSIVCNADQETATPLSEEITASMTFHNKLCQPEGGFVAGDTPLHTTIRLRDYRYLDTWQSFGKFAAQQNDQHVTPLDVVVDLLSKPHEASDDIRWDLLGTMKHLVHQGARASIPHPQKTSADSVTLNDYLFTSLYPTRASKTENVAQLKELLRELGEDYRYSLKMQKEIAVICVCRFINHHRNNPDLREMLSKLKADLNGARRVSPAPELQFIRQLRSQLWIVRIFRGLLGGTSTQVQLNNMIDHEIKRVTPATLICWSFFSKKPPQPEHEILELGTISPEKP